MDIMVMIILALVGAGMGSFACCQAWRIKKRDKNPRSHCMNCSYQLKWYDNIPIISWLLLGGKCRKCHKKIGFAEFAAEILTAAVFALSFLWWPWGAALKNGDGYEIAKFSIFLIETVAFMLLAVYDAKWKEMPSAILLVAMGLGFAFCGVSFAQDIVTSGFRLESIVELAGALVILPGFYYFMYRASKERWVGAGDWMLCVALALILRKFWLAMFCLFGSNMIGSVVMVPVLAAKRKKHAMIPFGPFLIVGFLVVFFLQSEIIKFLSF